jgi:uridylate kinase
LRYRRLLLKLSGEALMGKAAYGIDVPVVQRLSGEIRDAMAAGAEIAVVVGGGNIFRGLAGAAKGMDRATADYMGMLGDGHELSGAAQCARAAGRAGSAFSRPSPCRPSVRPSCARRRCNHLESRRAVISPPGTGNPLSYHDTTAALRAVEMNCEALAKGHAGRRRSIRPDPQDGPGAVRYDKADLFGWSWPRDLKVMDGAAIALARDNKLPVIVFSIEEHGNLLKVLRGEALATVISG